MRKEAANTTQAQSSHFPGESLATLLERVLCTSLLSAKGSCTKFPWDFAMLLLLFKNSSNFFFPLQIQMVVLLLEH